MFGKSLRDGVTLLGRVLSQISIGPKTLRASFLRFGASPSRWGHPSRVVLRISTHSIGTKASSVHLSFVTSRWGHPMGRVWFSSHSIETKFLLDNWSVFLQDGVTLFRSDSNDLISIEGISTVGLLGVVFRLVLGMVFCHPGFVRLALKSGGVLHIQPSSLPVRTLCVSLSPTKEWVLTLLLALLPLTLPSWVGLLRQSSGVSFTRAFFMRRYSARGGSLATLPEVGLPGKGC